MTSDNAAFVLTHDGQFKVFQISKQDDKATAEAVASGFPHHLVVEASSDLAPVPGPALVGLYNALLPNPPTGKVARFSTAQDGRKRVMARLHASNLLTSDAITVDTAAEVSSKSATTEAQSKEATMANKTKKAAKKVAKKTAKKTTTAPRGKGKPAGKAGDFAQVRAGTTRANILKEMTGTKTAEQIGAKLGIDKSLVSSNVFCLWRDCAIGYSYGPKGELTALFPAGKKMADAFKTAAK